MENLCRSSRPGSRPALDPVFFFINIQHPVCTWTYRDHGLTTYNWLPEKKIDIQSFLAVYSYLSMLRKLKVFA